MDTDLENLACEYFLFMSKFEYALKQTDFVKSDKYNNAKPDWDRFIEEISAKIKINFDDPHIQRMMNKPPKRQIYKDRKLDWNENNGTIKKSHNNVPRQLIECCLTIRNNLFHGGKIDDGNQGRNKYLLNAGLKILNAAKDAHLGLKQSFISAELDEE